MKMSSSREPAGFQPITITITVESQEERLALLAYTSIPNSVASGTWPNGACFTAKEQKTMRDFLRSLDKALIDPV